MGQTADKFKQMAADVQRITKITIGVGADAIYAGGIETGFTRTGKVARKAGGNWFLARSAEALQPPIGPRMAHALTQGPNAVNAEVTKIGAEMVAYSRAIVVVVSHYLQSTIHALTGMRQSTFGATVTGQGGAPPRNAPRFMARPRYSARAFTGSHAVPMRRQRH